MMIQVIRDGDGDGLVVEMMICDKTIKTKPKYADSLFFKLNLSPTMRYRSIQFYSILN